MTLRSRFGGGGVPRRHPLRRGPTRAQRQLLAHRERPLGLQTQPLAVRVDKVRRRIEGEFPRERATASADVRSRHGENGIFIREGRPSHRVDMLLQSPIGLK